MPQLDKSSKKYICPKCEKKTFVIYLTDDGKEINSNVGRCDREDNCSHHYTPKEYYSDNGIDKPIERTKYTPPPIKPPSYIDIELIKGSLSHYDKNNFVQFLEKRFGKEVTTKAVERYFIGTSKRWKGANIFYQFDEVGKCRTGKIMLYNPDTGKRIKEPNNCIDWLHTKINNPNYNLNQCLFGSHLLKDKAKTVNIVESEKTAVICSIFYPQCIWVATGGKENLKLLNASILKYRDVTLYPDLKAFDKWSVKAKELNFNISDYLERIATPEQREAGEDLADFLLRIENAENQYYNKNVDKFSVFSVDEKQPFIFSDTDEAKPTPITEQNILPSNYTDISNKAKPEPIQTNYKNEFSRFYANPAPLRIQISESNKQNPKKDIKEDWSEEIKELKTYFDNTTLPPEPIKLNQCTTINNVNQFIEISLIRATANNGNPFFEPELNQLRELKNINNLRLSK